VRPEAALGLRPVPLNRGFAAPQSCRWRHGQPLKRLGQRVPQDGFGAPLGHPGPPLSCPRQPRHGGGRTAPRSPQSRLTWAVGVTGKLFLRRLGPPRARAEAGGGGGGEGRRRGIARWCVGRSPPPLVSPDRLAQVASRCKGALLPLTCGRSGGASRARRRLPVAARAGTGASGSDATFLVGTSSRRSSGASSTSPTACPRHCPLTRANPLVQVACCGAPRPRRVLRGRTVGTRRHTPRAPLCHTVPSPPAGPCPRAPQHAALLFHDRPCYCCAGARSCEPGHAPASSIPEHMHMTPPPFYNRRARRDAHLLLWLLRYADERACVSPVLTFIGRGDKQAHLAEIF